MAIFDDDFQGYAIGASVPFGNWLLDTSASINVIVAGDGPSGTTRSYALFGQVVIDPAVTGYLASFSFFVAIQKSDRGNLLNFANGPNGLGQTFNILSIEVEDDSTISVLGPATELLGNSHDDWFEFANTINFLHVRVQLSDVPVSGVNHVNINCQVILNGKQVISFNKTTGMAVANLTHATSEVNRFQLSGKGAFAAVTLDGLQAASYYPHPGSPNLLAIQAPAEVNLLPDSSKIRVIQAVLEVDILQAQGIRAEYIHSRHRPGE